MNDSDTPSDTVIEPRSNERSTVRLVIRAEIIPEKAPVTVEQHSQKRAFMWASGCVALLLALSWIGFNAFRTDALSPPTDGMHPSPSPTTPPTSAAAPVADSESPHPVAAGVASVPPVSTEERSPQSSALATDPERAAPFPIVEVIPDVPRSALQTIRGTVRVSVRVTIGQQGAVIAAASEDPGPSRYFERLSLDASRKWQFAPANSAEPRSVLVRFSFTREAAMARVDSDRID